MAKLKKKDRVCTRCGPLVGRKDRRPVYKHNGAWLHMECLRELERTLVLTSSSFPNFGVGGHRPMAVIIDDPEVD